MSSWAGFTDEELSRLRQQNCGEQESEGVSLGGRKKAAINTAKRQRPREKIRTRATPGDAKVSLNKKEERVEDQRSLRNNSTASSSSREPSSLRSDSRELEEEKENSSPECERRAKNKGISEEAPPKYPDKDTIDKGVLDEEKTQISSGLPEIIDEKEKIQAIELSVLEKMQEKQKQMEEENKRKKAALQETIKKRYQRTQAEAQMLSLVQKELSHLDSLLSADVAILRDKIEESSRDYLHAQKRYEKAEQEFVQAKMDLHRKTERKDLLTEHLYTIIRENELRKAKKLEELMTKLNSAPDVTRTLPQGCLASIHNYNESSHKESSVSQAKKGPHTQNENGNSVESSNGALVDSTTDDENKKAEVGVNNVTGKGPAVEDQEETTAQN
ncbi:RAB6-interacting golgin-like [Montipora capricornis]|uniref:RAB6-interacting golgin-like n=1 Tax=Montipora capricornis TaxID=246305 RepID=UPI0035F1ACE7